MNRVTGRSAITPGFCARRRRFGAAARLGNGKFHDSKISFRHVKSGDAQHQVAISFSEILYHIAKNNE
ncbi:MAG: hypothetical protein WA924_04725 [Burkholderiaceae bacterium]